MSAPALALGLASPEAHPIPAVEVDALARRFGAVEALCGVDLEARTGSA
jgi:ABC-type histidine transport system ATPase subunit